MGERRFLASRALRGVAAAAGVLAAVGPLAGCGGYIRSDELKRGIDTLRSIASEGKLLAQDVARDRSRSTFARVHASELAQDADHEAQKLNDAGAKGPLVQRKAEAVSLAQDISDALGDLEVAPGDEATGQHVATRLRHYATDADSLSKAVAAL